LKKDLNSRNREFYQRSRAKGVSIVRAHVDRVCAGNS
jgi:hypothetical protein